MNKNSQKVVSYRRRVKIKLIAYKGGKCSICGYNKDCPSAYCFHHTDPNTKDFTISKYAGSFEKIKLEADKCILVCANCHAEEHDKIIKKLKQLNNIIEIEPKPRRAKGEAKCKECNEQFNPSRRTQQFCSRKCFHLYRKSHAVKKPIAIKTSNKKLEVSKEELQLLIDAMPYTKIGEKFNVSGNAIKKRCIKLGVKMPSNRRGYWTKFYREQKTV